jgi:hypothetical protein
MPVRKILGTAVESNTITSTQLTTTLANQITNAYGQANAAYSAANTGGGPKVRSLIYPGNDTAANTIGGQTMYITGSGFAANAAIYINGAAVPSQSFISASNISFTTPNLASATYPVYLINPEDGATAILIPGILISGEPAWVTAAGSLSASQDELAAWSYNLSATGDTPITYALAAGNTLPTGVSLAANGLISGTITSPTGNVTTYTFSVIATDAQNQDSTRQFTVTTSTGEGALFANNVLLIHADGTNNQNNHHFLDSSNNNFTITRNGNATQGSFSPFSQTGWSNYFDGSGDSLNLSYSTSAFDWWTSDYTIEAWVYSTNLSTWSYLDGGVIITPGMIGNASRTDTTNYWSFGPLSNGTVRFKYYNGASVEVTSSATITNNTWNHIAMTKTSSGIVIWVNGVGTSAAAVSGTPQSGTGTGLSIGQINNTSITGYISNLRILKGTALYTSNFTLPTSALTAVSNTSLLTCQSNRFIDNSTNAFAITRNGDVSVQAFSPFAPTAAYTTANVGGSGYFDGTGDYLTAPDNNAWDFGTGDFTIECWLYPTTSGTQRVISSAFSNGGNDGWSFEFTSGNLLTFYAEAAFRVTSTGTVFANTWTHVAVSRSGTSLKIFINGVTDGSVTDSTNISGQTEPLAIAATSSGTVPFAGYQSNLRIIKGTAIYTSNFTPPTSPLTNIANTQLLLNFTNAGIFDQTAKNVLETVGDAKVSTAQYKYGTGSMYFDGTGDRVHTGPSNPLIALGTGNFTVECWVNKLDTNHRGIWQISSTAGGLQASTSNLALGYQTGVWQIYRNGNSESASYSITPNTWYHTAVVRNSGTTKLYVNGTEVISVADTNNYTGTYMVIGGYYDTSYLHNGYIDDLRITRGYARYTSNFTPPTSALKDK